MKMEFQAQGYNECCPTTIAMLAGVPKNVIVEEAARFMECKTPTPWHVTREKAKRYGEPHGYNALIRHLVKQFLPAVVDIKSFANRIGWSYDAMSNATELSRLPRNGQGAVTIHFFAGGSHVMPYEGGKVLDPDGPGIPETMSQLRKRLRFPFRVCRITPIKFKRTQP